MNLEIRKLVLFLITTSMAFCFSQAAFAAPPETEPQIDRNEELRMRLKNTLENMQGTAKGVNMSALLDERFEHALERVTTATDKELSAIPDSLYNNFSILEVSSGQLRLAYDPDMRPEKPAGPKDLNNVTAQRSGSVVTIESTGGGYNNEKLDSPVYPDQAWKFEVNPDEDEPDEDQEGAEGGEQKGVCRTPGTTYKVRAGIMNTAIITMAIKDIAEQVCNETILFNVSLACIVTDVIAYVALGINENQALCNEHIGAAEGSATWNGLNVVHSNVQHVHDDLEDVDSALTLHDTTIQKDITKHDSDLKTKITNHDGDIKTKITTHDTDIKSKVATHDSEIKSKVALHDSELKSRLATHDSTIKAQLSTHDADIKARLMGIQATVNENQRLMKVSMARQLEVLRLLITPQGQREINPAILSCTGDDCPVESTILSCTSGTGWPCK